MTLAYIGLGSNLGDREALIRRAAELIGATRLSSIRETEPWGLESQPMFLNAVAEIDTELAPRRLLDELLDTERRPRTGTDRAAVEPENDRPRSAALRGRDGLGARARRPAPAAP